MILLVLFGCRDKDVIDTGTPVDDACPALTVSPSELAFDQVALGIDHVGDVVVTNLCVGETSMDTVAAWGAGSGAFSGDLTIPSLAPGESHTLSVVFSPTDFGVHDSSLQIVAAEQSAEVLLSGQAAADSDGDGHDSEAAGGGDCDDTDATTYPGAPDTWYDGVDSDCAGDSDYDQDGDGFDHIDHGGTDCDDEDPSLPTEEVWYDDIDQDCDGGSDYDQDGDGYDSAEYGGDDCDDLDADSFPGAPEVWYDGIDQDCGEDSDYDQDGDGEESSDFGGTDCDDEDPAVFLDSGEVTQDLIDDDCDGLVDEDFIARGDVLITEIHASPAVVSQALGEWFEVTNTTANDIDLIGWDVTGQGNTGFTVDDTLVVVSGATVVLGSESDTGINGDVAVDYEYDRNDLAFNDAADTLFLYLGDDWMTRVKWDADWPVSGGASMNLDVDYLTTNGTGDAAYWCASTGSFGDGDLGTPNAENEECTANDYDGDGFSRDDGDCDDDDAAIFPGADEDWDEVDNDCDGAIDNLNVEDVAAGYLYGTYGSYLTQGGSLGMADLDADGTLDIVAGTPYFQSYGRGGVYVVDGAPYTGYAGAISDNEYFSAGNYYYSYAARMDPHMGDVDDDGTADLFVVATDYYYGGTTAAGAFYFGGSLSGASTMYTDADVIFRDTLGYVGSSYIPAQRALNSLDIDGDGGMEVLLADHDQYYYSTGYDHGYAYLFLSAGVVSGSDFDLQDDADAIFSGADSEDHLGHSVGGGDVDADGYDDLLLGAPYADQGQTNSGSVYLIYGAASVTTATADSSASVTFYGTSGSDFLGAHSRNLVGDFDDDGAADVAIGSYTAGEIYVFYGASSLSGKVRVDTADVTITNASGPDYFGYTMDVGDLDGDGADDLVVGAPDYPTYYYASYYADEPGVVYWFSGADLTAAMSETDANASFTGSDTRDLFGVAITTDDLDGDGNDDLLVGAPGWGTYYGNVWIIESP